MKSLLQIATTTQSFNVLTAIQHAILGYTKENAGCIRDFLPAEYTVDLTEADLQPHFRRVNEIKVQERKSLPSGIEMLNQFYKGTFLR
jgi:hypothetical protein